MKKLLPVLCMLLAAASVFAASPSAVWDGKTLPPFPERVNDYAGILTEGEIAELTAISAELEEYGAIQLVFVIVNSLGGRPIEDYGLFLGRGWGIGQEERDNGVLILASMEDRALRIEVGYGLEGTLTDVACGRIIDNLMVPAFREGAYGRGLADAGRAVSALLKNDPVATAEYNKPLPVRKKPAIPAWLIIFVLFIIINLSLQRFRRRGIFWGGVGGSGGSWGHGGGGWSSGGGGFSGGGGSFGGGGSSGSW